MVLFLYSLFMVFIRKIEDYFSQRRTMKGFCLSVFFLLLLFLNFGFNLFNVVDQPFFEGFQRDSESLAIGKLVVSREKGIFYKGGFMGSILPKDSTIDKKEYQYKLFRKEVKVEGDFEYSTYNSQIAGQGLVMSVVQKLTTANPIRLFNFFRLSNAFFTALIFVLFLHWVRLELGAFVEIITFLGVFFSTWIIVFSSNLYWVLWAFYVPFISVLYLYRKRNLSHIIIFMITSIALLIKFFFTGFEYVTTVLIMSFIPIIYYGIYYEKSNNKILKEIVFFTLAVVLAVIINFVVLDIQIANSGVGDSNYLIDTFLSRTWGNTFERPDYDIVIVLKKYLGKHIFSFSFLSKLNIPSGLNLLLILPLFLIIIFVFYRRCIFISRKYKALFVLTILSFFAPLSWFIFFKGHAVFHGHMNNIIWSMPYNLFVLMIIGILLKEFFSNFKKSTS